ncbi:ATP-binding protein [Longispora albida]|uniref:ATP-binding protein n=1 Tax=Longispora albida TaxID=203523 RepID=UPI0003A60A75|nr:hypothetical protein [Longispora albida]
MDTVRALLDELARWRVRAARGTGKTRVSLRDLAAATGVPRSTLSGYLSGETLMPADVLDAVVLALGASAEDCRRWATAWEKAAVASLAQPPATPEAEGSAHPVPVPRQLPPRTADFVGRDDALDALERLGSGAGLLMITGAAGAGKTALAVEWSHRVRPAFPDGQLYINLHGYSSVPAVCPEAALAAFFRALGVPADRVPGDLEASVMLYRTVLADRRVLVVLDNACSADQVRPLLPGSPGSLALVTSRNTLTGLIARDGARRLSLGPLPPGRAAALLNQIIGARANPADMEPLAEACGRLPLALRIAAASLLDRPHMTAEGYAELLRGADALNVLEIDGDPSSSVRAAFALSYQALPAEAARMFRLTGLVPGSDFTAEAAGSLAEVDAAETRRTLALLCAAHLLERSGPDRYSMHDLLRHYAAELCGSVEAEEALARLYDWYLRRTSLANHHAFPDTLGLTDPPDTADAPDRETALAWFEAELVNLIDAAQRAYERHHYSAGWLLTDHLVSYLHTGGHYTHWDRVTRLGLSAAIQDASPRALAIAYFHRGMFHNFSGRPDEAEKHYRLAMPPAAQWGHPRVRASLASFLCIVLMRQGKAAEAERHLHEGLAMSETHRDPISLARAHIALGVFYTRVGRTRDLHHHLRRSISILGDTGNPLAGQAHGVYAWALSTIGDHEGALTIAARALDLAADIPNHQLRRVALTIRALAYCELGRHGEARRDLAQARALSDRIGDPIGHPAVLHVQARIDLLNGNVDDARRVCEEGIAHSGTTAENPEMAPLRLTLAAAYRHLGWIPQARAKIDQVLTVTTGGRDPVAEHQARAELALLLASEGQPAQAATQALKVLTFCHDTGCRIGDAARLAHLAGAR